MVSTELLVSTTIAAGAVAYVLRQLLPSEQQRAPSPTDDGPAARAAAAARGNRGHCWLWCGALLSAVLGAGAYCDERLLSGAFVYDDRGTVVVNRLVDPALAAAGGANSSGWAELLTHDFWGEAMASNTSHKSFRPVVTATFRLQAAAQRSAEQLEEAQRRQPKASGKKTKKKKKKKKKKSKKQGKASSYSSGGATALASEDGSVPASPAKHTPLDPRPFHVANALLHGLVSALAVPAAYVALGGGEGGGGGGTAAAEVGAFQPPPLPPFPAFPLGAVVAGVFFALHPVHAEAVANVTGRAELLQALFYLVGFLTYAHAVGGGGGGGGGAAQALGGGMRKRSFARRFARALALSASFVACTLLAVLSKEPGVTMPIACVAYDLLMVARLSPLALLRRPGRALRRSRAARACAGRSAALLVFTAAVAAARLSLNGGDAPHLSEAQNPAGFARDPFVRFASVSWVYMLNARLLLLPTAGAGELCCDWSADSIPLVERPADPRFAAVLAFWASLACLLRAMLLVPPPAAPAPHSSSSDDAERPRMIAAAAAGQGGRLQLGQARCLVGAALVAVPFALSANVFFPVGFVLAERVLYLPSFGYCVLCGHAAEWMMWCGAPAWRRAWSNADEDEDETEEACEAEEEAGAEEAEAEAEAEAGVEAKEAEEEEEEAEEEEAEEEKVAVVGAAAAAQAGAGGRLRGALVCALVGALALAQWRQTRARAVEWGSPLLLWAAARRVNPVSAHAAHNHGLELSWAQRQAEAVEAFAFSLGKNPTDCATRLALVLSLRHTERCTEAQAVAARGFELLEGRRAAAEGLGNDSPVVRSLLRDMSSMTAAEALCERDIGVMGKKMYKAVQLDPTNEFAMQQASDLLKLASRMGAVRQ